MYFVVGDESVRILSERASQYYEQTRFMDDENDYLPYQQKSYAPLLLMYYQGYHTKQQYNKLAELIHNGQIDKIKSDSSTNVTTKIGEILSPLEQLNDSHFVLMEGAPGIGKSVLLKEIAYRWGIREHLKTFKLVLLFSLHDPRVQGAKTITDLLMVFCDGDSNGSKLADLCSQYFFRNGGKDLLLCFDGFDELPGKAQKHILITRILARNVLSKCSLIVSSRPHASVGLRIKAKLRVEVLGFSKEDREQFLQQTLQGDVEMQKIKEFTEYLKQHLTISSLCYVPFNIVILLYLYKEGSCLPKSSTELYSKFITLIICRNFTRLAISSEIGFSDLTNLPEPCNRIVKQLSKLSFDALNYKKLTFTFDEIKAVCPDIMTTPNCFGLLRVIKCLGPDKPWLFYFIHYSIQEFLAAHYVSQLPPDKESSILKEKFWSSCYFNMFSMYVALTKGQRASFKHFLSGDSNDTSVISSEFLGDQLKCFHLFHCFHEAGDNKICKSIENVKIFYDKKINLSPIASLAPSDVRCLAFFVHYSSHKKWVELNLENCQIQDHGVHTLLEGLKGSRVVINCLQLNCNSLTSASSSDIADIVINCKVKELWIGDNKSIGEDDELYSKLSNPSSLLQILHLSSTKLSSSAITKLFTTLAGKGNKLKKLYIADCNVTSEECQVIATTMKENHSLVELDIRKNPISIDAIKRVFQAIQHNNDLQKLILPGYPKKPIRSQQEMVIKKREIRGNRVKLDIKLG